MKQLTLGVLLSISCFSFACDNCNVYLNLSPNDYKNSIGIYYRARMMYGEYDWFGEMIATKHAGHGNDMEFWGKEVFETYQTYELRGNYFFKKKWKSTIILPFINNTQTIGNLERYNIQGIGDPTFIQSYQVLNTKKDTNKNKIVQRLTVGIGIKFPIGKTNITFSNGVPNLDLQPGSGSWDFLSYFAYSFKYRFIGFSTNLNLKRNGRDNLKYRYGTTINGTINIFTDLKIKAVTVRLLAGSYIEHSQNDFSYNGINEPAFKHIDTGGNVFFGNTGIQVYTKKWNFFGEFQKVLRSELNGFTQLLTKNRLNLGVIYNF